MCNNDEIKVINPSTSLTQLVRESMFKKAEHGKGKGSSLSGCNLLHYIKKLLAF